MLKIKDPVCVNTDDQKEFFERHILVLKEKAPEEYMKMWLGNWEQEETPPLVNKYPSNGILTEKQLELLNSGKLVIMFGGCRQGKRFLQELVGGVK